jgi:propanol-preferring alcohol dehydrogenase
VRAQRIHDWGGPLHLEEVDEPTPGSGEVLVQVEACSIGLTVLNAIRGDLGREPANLPRIPGHELVGRITAVGGGVDPGRVGERVMAYFYLFCGSCRRCTAGTEPLCERLAGYVGVNRDGGYAELVVLPERNAVPLAEGIDAALATAIPDAIATPVHVAERAGIEPGDRVAVVAAGGGVGVHMVQVARAHGAHVAGLEVAAPKLRLLEELGATPVRSSDFAAVDLPEEWEGEADVVVDLLGSEASLRWAGGVLARRGRLVLLTTFRDVTFAASPRELVFREASVIGSRYASRVELQRAAELVESGSVRPVVSLTVGIEEIEAAHEDLRAGRLVGRGALVWDDMQETTDGTSSS